jgi:MoxR-like ATPase
MEEYPFMLGELKSFDVGRRELHEFLLKMSDTAFQGRALGDAYQALVDMFSGDDVTIFLGVAGSMSTAGMWRLIKWLVEETRSHPVVRLGASPRAGIALVRLAKALAYLDSRNYVIPDDVKGVAKSVLTHRIVIKPEYEVSGVTPGRVVEDLLAKVEVPKP